MPSPRSCLLCACWLCGLVLLTAGPVWTEVSPERSIQGAAQPAAGQPVAGPTVRLLEREQAILASAGGKKGKTTAPLLKRFLGKYAFESAERDKQVRQRLRDLFGTEYVVYQRVSGVQSPIAGNDSFIVLDGCKAHDCASNAALVMLWQEGTSQAVITLDDVHSTYYGPPIKGPQDVDREKRFLRWMRDTEVLSPCQRNVDHIEAALRRRW